ncbi:unnamed protein product [Linum trigynum]|uniref:Uncharacterized protein n=1 Tax=Linum trigynum TaxID=586398 RepID=A0AAV2DLP5_9ROSI
MQKADLTDTAPQTTLIVIFQDAMEVKETIGVKEAEKCRADWEPVVMDGDESEGRNLTVEKVVTDLWEGKEDRYETAVRF